jgi:hypothetical protein
MNKLKSTWLKSSFRSILLLLGLGFVAAWLVLGNLGCIAEILLNGIEMKFTPEKQALLPYQTKTMEASLLLLGDRELDADWTITNTNLPAFSSVKFDDSGFSPEITITASDPDSFYASRETWNSRLYLGGPRVTAKYVDPWSKTLLGEDVKATLSRYLPLETNKPVMEVIIPMSHPILSGDGFVRAMNLGCKAEIKNAPESWKYTFEFDIDVFSQIVDPGAIHPVRFSTFPKDVTVSADGKSAKFKLMNLQFRGLEKYISDYDVIDGSHEISVLVTAKTSDGGNWVQKAAKTIVPLLQ